MPPNNLPPPPSEAEAEEIMKLAFARADGGLIEIQLDAMSAFTLIGLLQLATRHPDLPPSTNLVAKSLAAALQGRLITACGPEIGQLIEYGWHTQYDIGPETEASNGG